MTTVIAVCNPPAMYADKRLSTGNGTATCMKLTYVVEAYCRAIVGLAGDAGEAQRFIAWLVAHGFNTDEEFKRAKGKHFELLVLLDTGELRYYEDGNDYFRIENTVFGIGSGAAFAIGALEAGASPERAFQIAAKRDSATSPEYDHLTF
jgi:ATP-dependent protease HslVU (ClpYQ) peptidase subunit